MTRRRGTTAKDLAIVDAYERDPSTSLSKLARKHHRSLSAFKREVPTRKVGGRLRLASRHERRLDRDRIPIVADIDGRPVVVVIQPLNDTQYFAAKEHDSGVYASVTKGDDSRLAKTADRVMVDRDTGQRYKLYGSGPGLRDAADIGEFEISDLYYGGGPKIDVAGLEAAA